MGGSNVKFCRRMHRYLFCSFHPLFSALSRPLFFFCFLLAVSPGILLASLLGWKALFYPAAMPHFCRGIFLLLWLAPVVFLSLWTKQY